MTSELKQIIEALFFVADGPLNQKQIAQVLENVPLADIEQAIERLRQEYETRAFHLVEVAGGYGLRSKSEYAFWLRKFKKVQATRLSRAAMETLAIVAYRQPIMKAEVEKIRGVEVGSMLRTLMEKDLVRIVGRQDLPGRPLIYGTTKKFLEVFDLNDLSDLPTLEELKDLAPMELDEMGEDAPALAESDDHMPTLAQIQAMNEQEEHGQAEAGPKEQLPDWEEEPAHAYHESNPQLAALEDSRQMQADTYHDGNEQLTSLEDEKLS